MQSLYINIFCGSSLRVFSNGFRCYKSLELFHGLTATGGSHILATVSRRFIIRIKINCGLTNNLDDSRAISKQKRFEHCKGLLLFCNKKLLTNPDR